jgi:hypothetical protein
MGLELTDEKFTSPIFVQALALFHDEESKEPGFECQNNIIVWLGERVNYHEYNVE